MSRVVDFIFIRVTISNKYVTFPPISCPIYKIGAVNKKFNAAPKLPMRSYHSKYPVKIHAWLPIGQSMSDTAVVVSRRT